MERITPKEKYRIMNDISLAVSCALGKPVYFETMSNKQVSQVQANKFIREFLNVKKHILYKKDDREKLKHFHLTKDAIMLVGGQYLYVNAEEYHFFEDIDINERVVSVWFLSNDDAVLFR